MTVSLSTLKQDLHAIIRAGVDAVGAARVIERALADAALAEVLTSRPLHVVAVGKAAAPMAAAFAAVPALALRQAVAVGTHADVALPDRVEWIESSHPFPDERSDAAGRRALAVAQGVHSGEALVILLSGGASALMAAPVEGISLADKISTTRTMMNAGADIHALNTVRRHLSNVKGGRLAAACVGTTITLALSDVVGDDLNAIGSGPGVADHTTWSDAAAALDRFGGREHLEAVRAVVRRGLSGEVPDTPKAGHPALARATARVIGGRLDAMAGAKAAAEARGYRVMLIDEPVVGEARVAGPAWLERARQMSRDARGPVCVISGGETTVRVTGNGLGGRNLEFVLSITEALAGGGKPFLSAEAPGAKAEGLPVAAASIGTDGIDGSSGVAGAIADSTTLARAAAAGLGAPGQYLATNNSLAYFAPLDDVVRLGRTHTNVGDLQVIVIHEP
ncbi:MAG: glycerate kinase [Vicinamibacterales bacterium]